MTKRVAVIGAGPSGLAQLRAFQSAKEKGAEAVSYTHLTLPTILLV